MLAIYEGCLGLYSCKQATCILLVVRTEPSVPLLLRCICKVTSPYSGVKIFIVSDTPTLVGWNILVNWNYNLQS